MTTTTEEMDSGAMVRRAYAAGVELQSYDPNQLVAEVGELLRQHGLTPDSEGRAGMAAGGAGMLLRAFGILPAGDHRMIDRLNAPDADER